MNDYQEFYFNYSKPSFDDVLKEVKRLKKYYENKTKNYEKEIKKVLENYNERKYKRIINRRCRIFIRIIKKVINFFPQFKKTKYKVFLHGSYARGVSRFDSDIDLNILFENNGMVNEHKTINELIAAMIADIVSFKGRDKVHDIMLSAPKISNKRYSFYNGNKYKVIFKDGKAYKYKSRDNFEQVMTSIQNASIYLDDFRSYILSHSTSKECNEWCYSFRNICGNYSEFSIEDIISEADKEIAKSVNVRMDTLELIKRKKKEILDYNYFGFKESKISNINIEYKKNVLNHIYGVIAILRRGLIVKGERLGLLNIPEFLKSKQIKKYFSKDELKLIENEIFVYNWSLARLEYAMKVLGLNFSSRENKVIDVDILKLEYKKLYNELDYECFQNNSVEKIKEVLIKILDKLEKILTC